MITGYIVERCEDGTDKWLRCNARLCPDLFYKVGLKNFNLPLELHLFGKKTSFITVRHSKKLVFGSVRNLFIIFT